jgi:hypothetical protein
MAVGASTGVGAYGVARGVQARTPATFSKMSVNAAARVKCFLLDVQLHGSVLARSAEVELFGSSRRDYEVRLTQSQMIEAETAFHLTFQVTSREKEGTYIAGAAFDNLEPYSEAGEALVLASALGTDKIRHYFLTRGMNGEGEAMEKAILHIASMLQFHVKDLKITTGYPLLANEEDESALSCFGDDSNAPPDIYHYLLGMEQA